MLEIDVPKLLGRIRKFFDGLSSTLDKTFDDGIRHEIPPAVPGPPPANLIERPTWEDFKRSFGIRP